MLIINIIIFIYSFSHQAVSEKNMSCIDCITLFNSLST